MAYAELTGRIAGELALFAGVGFLVFALNDLAVDLRGIPVWINAERRQRIGTLGRGRNAFALFLEGGVYDRPMPWNFRLDAYLQGGVVGFRRRDKFVDGALTLTRPLYRNFSVGFGLWGGAQPGLYWIDARPRLSYRVRDN